MGREIRRVPADWEHPKYSKDEVRHDWQKDSFRPLFDNDYESACLEWYAAAAKFVPTEYAQYYHEYSSPPDAESYRVRKWTEEEATHYQVYETVSEGTPVTPHFATKGELVDYLVSNGDFWDQKRGHGGWTLESAENFLKSEWAPSMVAKVSDGKVEIQEPRDMD